MSAPGGEDLPLDHLQGTAPPYSTPVYSNNFEVRDRETIKLSAMFEMSTFGAFNQCVQFARRWLWDTKGLWLPDITVAAMIFHIDWVVDPNTKIKVPVRSVRNGTKEFPVADSFIIYASHFANFPGHIGVITKVSREQMKVYVACQNRHYKKWDADYSIIHDIKVDSSGQFWLQDREEPVIGWVTFPDRPNVALPNGYTLPMSPLVLDREKFRSQRPLPSDFDASQLPHYELSGFRRHMTMWKKVMADFSPHWVLFPFFFGYTLTKFFIWFPIFYGLKGLIQRRRIKKA